MDDETGWIFSIIGLGIQILSLVGLIVIPIFILRLIWRFFRSLNGRPVLPMMRWRDYSLWLRIVTIITAVLTVTWPFSVAIFHQPEQFSFSRFVEIHGGACFVMIFFVIIALLVESSEWRRLKKRAGSVQKKTNEFRQP